MRNKFLAIATAVVCMISSSAFAAASTATLHSKVDKGPCYYVKNGHTVMWASAAMAPKVCKRLDNRYYWKKIGYHHCHFHKTKNGKHYYRHCFR